MDAINLGIEISSDSRYASWLKDCYIYANNSKHPSTHNAAILIKDDKIILRGVNNLPTGVLEKAERFQSPNKHLYLNHAERDLVFLAAKKGISMDGLSMVMPWLPCVDCANAIISSGIKTLIVHRQMISRTKESWVGTLSDAIVILREANVSIIAFDGVIGVKAYMHKQEWNA